MVTGIERTNAHMKQVVATMSWLLNVIWRARSPNFGHTYQNANQNNVKQRIVADESDIRSGMELQMRIVRRMGKHKKMIADTVIPRFLAWASYTPYASSTSSSNFRYHFIESFERATLVKKFRDISSVSVSGPGAIFRRNSPTALLPLLKSDSP